MSSKSEISLSRTEIIHICGDIEDWKISAILKSKAKAEDLELAMAWAYGESDVAGEARLPLSGSASQLFEILVGDREQWEDDR